MPYSYERVTLGETSSNTYPVYANNTTADNYLLAKFGATAWPAATDVEKSQALISATRLLDKQCWQGDVAEEGQELAWPRINTGIDGVEDDEIPTNIINGCIELANLILGGSNVESTSLPGAQGLQSIKAGSVALTYFRDAAGFMEQNSRFPVVVQEFVGRYLCGSSPAVTGVATGTTASSEAESVTGEEFGFNDGI